MSMRPAPTAHPQQRASRRMYTALVGLFVLLWALPAAALEVYINNVRVTGALRNQQMKVTQVTFAANGDLYIDAPGYKIEGEKVPPPAAPAPSPQPAPAAAQSPTANQQRIWLVVNNTAPGHYTVKTRLNGLPLADLPAHQPQYVQDITDRLADGKNRIQVIFLPEPGAPMTPQPVEAINLMVGLGGTGADGSLNLTRMLGSLKQPSGRRAAEEHQVEFVVQLK